MNSASPARVVQLRGAPVRIGIGRGMLPRPVLDFASAPGRLGRTLSFPPPPGAPVPPERIDPAVRFLVRHATNGFCVPDYLEALALGYDRWLDKQLDPESIDDSAVETALAAYPSLTMDNDELYTTYLNDPASVVYELQEAVLLRAIYSRRQLYERMVEFWTDHFNINQLDEFDYWFKTSDDRRVVRQHALGTFPDMLHASARSGAMLWYLDNYINVAGAVQENYARELLELHTLGVDGPYSEVDVVEVARCFTGWTFHGVFTGGPFGEFIFYGPAHDTGAKVVLGQSIPAGGWMEDGNAVLDLLALHPKTAEFLSTKMARWLLCYEPPAALVHRLKGIYLSTGGSIKPMVREILSPEWQRRVPLAERLKLKRPYHHLTSVMRAAQVTSNNLLNLTIELQRMGQVPYWWPTPDGYPDKVAAWGKALRPRWEWASRLFDLQIPSNYPNNETLAALMATAPAGSSEAQAIAWVMTGGDADPTEVDAVQTFIDSQAGQNPKIVRREAFALLASGPGFQYY